MAKVLLINSPVREYAPPNNAPLGPLYIASYLVKHGHKCDVCDLNALRTINPLMEHWLNIFKADWDIVGLSGLITTYHSQRKILDYIIEHKKDFGDPLLIAGGGLATSAPEFTLRNMPELDALVIGEGEATALDLANGKSPPDVPGVRIGDGAASSRNVIPRLDDLPFPAFSKIPERVYLDNPIWGATAGNSSRIQFKSKRSLNMVASRGCPFSCKFCYDGIFGKKYRTRSVENVIAEIAELKEKYEIDFVGLVDDNTIADREWTVAFCEGLLAADLGVHWGCHARVDEVDPELLTLMKRSGCEYLGFGVESGSLEILKDMDKKADVATAARAIRQVREADMTANATFIAGYPGETKETLADTARFMRENDCLGSMFYATAYPGTPLWDDVKDKVLDVYDTEDNYIKMLGDATAFRVNLSELSDSDLSIYRDMAIGGIPF